jgi:hypothetical protein
MVRLCVHAHDPTIEPDPAGGSASRAHGSTDGVAVPESWPFASSDPGFGPSARPGSDPRPGSTPTPGPGRRRPRAPTPSSTPSSTRPRPRRDPELDPELDATPTPTIMPRAAWPPARHSLPPVPDVAERHQRRNEHPSRSRSDAVPPPDHAPDPTIGGSRAPDLGRRSVPMQRWCHAATTAADPARLGHGPGPAVSVNGAIGAGCHATGPGTRAGYPSTARSGAW